MAKRFSVRKGTFLILILLFPSLIYLFLFSGEHKYKNPPYFKLMQVVPNPETGVPDSIYHRIINFELTVQQGWTFTRDSLEDKVAMVHFIDAACSEKCTSRLYHLKNLQEKLDGYPQLKILTHVVFRDSVDRERLRQLATDYEAVPGTWYFLGCTEAQFHRLGGNSYLLATENQPADGVNNFQRDSFLVIDHKGHIRGVYDGSNYAEVKDIIEDLRMLIRDSVIPKKEKEAACPKHQKEKITIG